MPDRATTAVEIASNALVMIGASPISSFEDDDAGAVVANNIYEEIIQDALTSYPWRFSIKQSIALSRLEAAPDTLWDAAYQIPTDVLVLRRVTVNDLDINYEIYGDKIYCNAVSTDSVYANYIYRVTESAWPPYFRLLAQLRLAAYFAMAVIQKPDIAGKYEDMAELQNRKARNTDAQIDTIESVTTKRLINVRR